MFDHNIFKRISRKLRPVMEQICNNTLINDVACNAKLFPIMTIIRAFIIDEISPLPLTNNYPLTIHHNVNR